MRAETEGEEGTFPKRSGVRHSEEMKKMRQRPSSSSLCRLPFLRNKSSATRNRGGERGARRVPCPAHVPFPGMETRTPHCRRLRLMPKITAKPRPSSAVASVCACVCV